ncbi:hypothetical protein [Brevundimonas sp. LjRoot202]|uniref:hypothetical protein n=1 Tax=Brevundimonas sp. LjRoot202 TaxID=3342281 RepID=UPI003ECD3AB0
MSRENYLVDRIDRRREAPKAKAERTARAMTIRMEARKLLTAANDYEPDERAAFLGDVLDVVAEQLHPLIGRVEAATAFNSRAADICAAFKLGSAVKNAAAEQAFAKLTRAANDGGEG